MAGGRLRLHEVQPELLPASFSCDHPLKLLLPTTYSAAIHSKLLLLPENGASEAGDELYAWWWPAGSTKAWRRCISATSVTAAGGRVADEGMEERRNCFRSPAWNSFPSCCRPPCPQPAASAASTTCCRSVSAGTGRRSCGCCCTCASMCKESTTRWLCCGAGGTGGAPSLCGFTAVTRWPFSVVGSHAAADVTGEDAALLTAPADDLLLGRGCPRSVSKPDKAWDSHSMEILESLQSGKHLVDQQTTLNKCRT